MSNLIQHLAMLNMQQWYTMYTYHVNRQFYIISHIQAGIPFTCIQHVQLRLACCTYFYTVHYMQCHMYNLCIYCSTHGTETTVVYHMSFLFHYLQDFRFELAVKIQVDAIPDTIPEERQSRISVSNKYGLIFVGTSTGLYISVLGQSKFCLCFLCTVLMFCTASTYVLL